MKIKGQTRKLAVGCSKYCFEVVDKTDEVSSKQCFEMSQMFGGGLKGKIGEFAMKQSMKRMANKMKKAK